MEEDDENVAHQIFIKKYRSEKKSSNKPVGKTIVVLNIPPYASKESLRNVFSAAGDVDNITLIDSYNNEHKTKYSIPSEFFHDAVPFKFLIGFIVFKKSSSVDAVFALNKLPSLCGQNEIVENFTGVDKWIAEHNKRIVDPEIMQKEIEEYMKHYDKIKAAEESQDNTEVDEDGWIQVGKKGHYAGFKQNESVVHRLEQKLENQRKKAKRNLQKITGLYAFENRENKKKELLELRKKFEEDKSKLEVMRQNRKFKPY